MKFSTKILSLLLIVALTFSIVGCNRNKNPDNGNGNPGDTSSIVDDLPRDENGEFDRTYLEGVQLNMWS